MYTTLSEQFQNPTKQNRRKRQNLFPLTQIHNAHLYPMSFSLKMNDIFIYKRLKWFVKQHQVHKKKVIKN